MPKCRIIVKDEVNIKIEGLDLDVRKKLANQFKFELPYARYMPAVRLGRWDGKVAFFNLGGSTYTNLLPEIVSTLEDYNYDIELEDLREYRTQFEFDRVTADSYSDMKWPKGHPVAGDPIVLRDYQVEIINKFFENPQCIQEVATGAGKTLVTAVLSHRCEQFGRTIVIVPNKTLVTQTEQDYTSLGLDVGVYYGDRKEFGHTHTICTWQSLNVLLKNTKNKNVDISIGEFIEDVICVQVDEVHTVKADALKNLLTQVMPHIPIRWGLTGTVPKEDYNFILKTY